MTKPMKQFAFFYFLFIFSNVIAQKMDSNQIIELTVTNIKNIKGQLLISLHNQSGFPDQEKKAILNKVVKVTQSTMTVKLEVPKTGVYAISMMHDENENNKMDKNYLGIPKEGYGFSNNPSARFGAPTFGESKFEVKTNEIKKISIKLIYW